MTPIERLKTVIDFASQNGVPLLLDPEDILNLKKSDDMMIVIYISYLFHWLQPSDTITTPIPRSSSNHTPTSSVNLTPQNLTSSQTQPKKEPISSRLSINDYHYQVQQTVLRQLEAIHSKPSKEEIHQILETIGQFWKNEIEVTIFSLFFF